MSSPPIPSTISIPPPPPLDLSPPDESETNTLALLLPHQGLFAPPVLALLREHYSSYGEIAHWAPVKGFGRVIIVYEREEDARKAKVEGDWLKLEIPPREEDICTDEQDGAQPPVASKEYFDQNPRHGRRNKPKTNDLILRLHYLPPTPLHPDPSTTHLAPPELPHNFLISPPGSPPEGWEPIIEDAPNTSILAEDLQRALEALQLNGGGGSRRRGSKEIILDEGGVKVLVEDTTREDQEEDMDVEERLDSTLGNDAWSLPSQNNNNGIAIAGLGSLGGTPLGTPGYRMKPAPTARPPV